jgi:hypothetical protein
LAHRGCYARRRSETEIEKSRRATFTRRVFVIARHHEVLRRLGLDTIEGVKNYKGELIKDHKGRRDIQRITTNAGGQTLVFFLKRNWRPYKKDGLTSLFKRGEVWSQSRVEWENSLALQRAGLTVAEPIAFGEECGLLWENFSFVLTAAARGEMTLDEFLRMNTDAAKRRQVFAALACEVRRMHDAGLGSPDLFTRHIFVDPSVGIILPKQRRPTGEVVRIQLPVLKFCLIDMARLDRRRTLPPKLRARDLAALNVTAPLRFVGARERLGFLRIYGGDRRLRQLIVERSRHLLKRRKFADFVKG